MLNRRTNVLLSEEDYQLLSSLAEKTGKSMGALIRKAVRKVYGDAAPSQLEVQEEIKRLRKQVDSKGLDVKEIREMIEDGRRF